MTSSTEVDSVKIKGPIEFEIVNGGSPLAPDGSGVLQLTYGDGGLVIVPDGSTINGIAVTMPNGDAWAPSDGAYVWTLAAASTHATVNVNAGGVAADQQIVAPGWPHGSFVVGPNMIQIAYRQDLGKWAVPNWNGYGHPAGLMSVFGGSGVPLGWLACDGSTFDAGVYAELASVIGTTYGAGPALPDQATHLPAIPGGAPANVKWVIFANR